MVAQALVAYAHFLSIFTALAMLVAETALYRKHMRPGVIQVLPRLDLAYLMAVVAIIVSGLLRVFYFAKGADFYAANPIFWLKMAMFILVGLLSLPPTFEFLRNRRIVGNRGLELDRDRLRFIRGFLIAELVVFALIPLAATLMARGIGM